MIPECAWQVERNVGPEAEAEFVRRMASGQFKVVDVGTADYQRCAELIDAYADLGLGLVDASVVTVAENLQTRLLATLNHRHFAVVRPRHAPGFDLIPSPPATTPWAADGPRWAAE